MPKVVFGLRNLFTLQLMHINLPADVSQRQILLLDPMLATGGSACSAIQVLLDNGVKEQNIIFVCLIAAPPGVERVHREFPRIKILAGEVDEALNEKNYIIPG